MKDKDRLALAACEKRRLKVESALADFALAVAVAAGCDGKVSGEQVVLRVGELRLRERTLIDICHEALACLDLSAEEPSPDRSAALLERLESVRLWWYPVKTLEEQVVAIQQVEQDRKP